jgi:hypothetical protein
MLIGIVIGARQVIEDSLTASEAGAKPIEHVDVMMTTRVSGS